MRRLFWVAPLLFLPLLAAAYSRPGNPQGYVSDFASILSAAARQTLETKLAAFKQQSGDELAVVSVSSLGEDTIENYAVSLFADWGIGEQGKDNGVLLLVAPNEREVRIEVGYGLEGALTDAQSYWIIQNEVLPAFKNGDYAAGIEKAVDKIIAAVGGEVIPSESPRESGGGLSSDTWFFLIFIVPIWLASILGRSKSWWLGGVLGAVGGALVGTFYGFLWIGVISVLGLGVLGLLFDFLVSRAYAKGKTTGRYPWWIGGGRGFGGGGHGGFGGFGGGMSGGGGSSGKW